MHGIASYSQTKHTAHAPANVDLPIKGAGYDFTLTGCNNTSNLRTVISFVNLGMLSYLHDLPICCCCKTSVSHALMSAAIPTVHGMHMQVLPGMHDPPVSRLSLLPSHSRRELCCPENLSAAFRLANDV